VLGVAVKPDHLEILTDRAGSEEISVKLRQYQTLPLKEAEKKLPREANIEGKMYPVYIRSSYSEYAVEGARIEVYGDLQIKVGDWEWGDPLDFDPVSTSVVGTEVPVVPLSLNSELNLGLGWMDRFQLISDTIMRSQHEYQH
jgi:hypothetical protein